MQRVTQTEWADLKRLFRLWSQQYCKEKSYWRIEGRPVFSILNLTDFAAHYGLTTFAMILLYARKVVFHTIGVNPFFIGVFSEANQRNVYIANRLPIDAATGYALLPDWRGPHIQRYERLIEKRVSEWTKVQTYLTVPFFPVVSAGWDASMRGENLDDLRDSPGFPWTPIVTGVTPELFGTFLDSAVDFNASNHPAHNIIFVHAWNEWSEGAVIEPSDRYGISLLEEIRKRAELSSQGPNADAPSASGAPRFIAYLYPGWHRSVYRPELDEWGTLDNFKPYFSQHMAPPRPLPVPYDDSRPITAARQIKLARDFGLSGFTYFLYYAPDGFVLEAPIRAAFERTENQHDFHISMTWCFRLPHITLPIPLSSIPKRAGIRRAAMAHGLHPQHTSQHPITVEKLQQLCGQDVVDELLLRNLMRMDSVAKPESV